VSPGQKGTGIGTNRNFLGFAHPIHIGAIGRSCLFLVDIVINANGSIVNVEGSLVIVV
jgi:hypothetical protein